MPEYDFLDSSEQLRTYILEIEEPVRETSRLLNSVDIKGFPWCI